MLDHMTLKDILHYSKETGVFTWLIPTSDRCRVGQVAGTLRPDGYVSIQILKRRYMAHRLAWFYVTGVEPPDEIDHENFMRSDNRWDNLRLATSKQNKENSRLRSTNKSGYIGVHWDKSRGKWLAYVTHHKKFINLGRFDSQLEAAKTALIHRKRLFSHFPQQ